MDSFIVGNSVLIRRECFTRLGMFDESLRWGDYHMWLRIARHYRVDYVDRVLTKIPATPDAEYTRHAGRSPRQPPGGLKAIEQDPGALPGGSQELGAIGRPANRVILF